MRIGGGETPSPNILYLRRELQLKNWRISTYFRSRCRVISNKASFRRVIIAFNLESKMSNYFSLHRVFWPRNSTNNTIWISINLFCWNSQISFRSLSPNTLEMILNCWLITLIELNYWGKIKRGLPLKKIECYSA